MCAIDLDPCEVWRERQVTARKDHVCSCCGGLIRAGRIYVRHFSIFKGNVTAEKMCATCDRVADRFQDEHGTRTNPSGMPDLLSECISNEADDIKTLGWRRDLKMMRRRHERRLAAEAPS